MAATPLVLAGPTAAAFIGLSFEQLPLDEFGILTCRIYAQFDGAQGSSGNDFLSVVADCDVGSPLVVQVHGGTFFQHPANTHAGGDLSPQPLPCVIDPTVCLDTFVTIGKLTSLGDETILPPFWPGFRSDTLEAEQGGWAVNVTKYPEQATPGLADNPPDRVLLMQLSTAQGAGFSGWMGVLARSDGVVRIHCVGFDTGCFADTDGDSDVDVDDFLIVLEQWGPCPSGCPGDVTANGVVDVADFLTVLTRWGPCP
jgi:hypothetical protein